MAVERPLCPTLQLSVDEEPPERFVERGRDLERLVFVNVALDVAARDRAHARER
jgi:hypothetical protein